MAVQLQGAAGQVFGAAGANHSQGLVPDPGATTGLGQVLTDQGWAASFLNIIAYGGKGDGTTDNTTALNNALAALSGTGGLIYFPPGKYRFNSQISFSYPATGVFSVSIKGSGSENTILYWPSGNGIVLTLANAVQSCHFADMTFSTGSSPGGAAIEVSSTATNVTAQSDVTNVTFRGDDFGGNFGAGSDYWTTCFNISVTNEINFLNCLFIGSNASNGEGNGVVVAGNSSYYAFNYSFAQCSFLNLNYGVQAGNYVQGIAAVGSEFSGNIGIAFVGTAGTNAVLLVSSCEFNCFQVCIWSAGNSSNDLFEYQVANNIFYLPTGAYGLDIAGNGGGSIVGNAFQPAANDGQSSNTGVAIGSTATGFVTTVVANTFYDLALGIFLTAASKGVNVQSNAYSNNSTNITNSGSGNTIGGGST